MEDKHLELNELERPPRPTVTALIPWRDRAEITSTLAENSALLARHKVEILVLNCGGDSRALRRMLEETGLEGLRQIDIPDLGFNKSLSLNLGAFCSNSAYLFMLDTDVVLKSDVIGESFEFLTDESFVVIGKVFESEPDTSRKASYIKEMVQRTELICTDGRRAAFEHNHLNFSDGSRPGPGLMIVRRDHFLKVQGSNSNLLGWGFEDLDLHIRLQFVLDLKRINVGEALHLTHGDNRRNIFGGSRAESERLNISICYENYSRGHFLGTYQDDVRLWRHRIAQTSIS